jgi:hypothetical protein
LDSREAFTGKQFLRADQHERTPVLLNIRVGIADRPARAHALHEAQAVRVRIQTHETLQTKDATRKLVEYFTELRLVDRCGGTEDTGTKRAVWSLSSRRAMSVAATNLETTAVATWFELAVGRPRITRGIGPSMIWMGTLACCASISAACGHAVSAIAHLPLARLVDQIHLVQNEKIRRRELRITVSLT